MPKAKAPKATSDKPKAPTRRKSRPKFDVEPEQVAAPAAGWVYRDTEPEPLVEEKVAVVEPVVVVMRTEPTPEPRIAPNPADNPLTTLPMIAFGVMAIGIGAFVHVALFAVKTMNQPIRMASGILGRLRRA